MTPQLMPCQPALPIFDSTWIEIKDANPSGVALFRRHYSFQANAKQKQPHFVGPGEKMVLITPCARALWAWRKFTNDSGQLGVNNAVFRNEGAGLSSLLILEAMRLGWERWPGERFYTYVDTRKVRSTNPGYCYLMAGWRKCGITQKRRYLILEALPV